MSVITRPEHIANKVVFVDGLPGCGKTLFSTLISSMDRVELLSYSYEVEHISALFYLNKIPIDAASTLINLQMDLKIYNTMMGRDTNFRAEDLSSVFNNHNPIRYLKRILEPGDEVILDIISRESPILNLSVHNLLSYSEPIWEALGGRCVFIEVVRHPLYMMRQQVLNMKNLLGNKRHFTIYFKYKNQVLPYYVNEWKDSYLKCNPVERVINFIDKLTNRTCTIREELKSKYNAKIITIPFEPFVKSPDNWIKKIEDVIETKSTDATAIVMKEQKVPRSVVAQGIDLDIYKRCGWRPPVDGLTERDELNIRRQEFLKDSSQEAIIVLDKLCANYEKEYWSPD